MIFSVSYEADLQLIYERSRFFFLLPVICYGHKKNCLSETILSSAHYVYFEGN